MLGILQDYPIFEIPNLALDSFVYTKLNTIRMSRVNRNTQKKKIMNYLTLIAKNKGGF